MPGALKPFWIYWGILVSAGIVILMCPLLLFVILSLLLVIVPLWLIIVYLIGYVVQGRRGSEKLSRRMALAFLCSFMTVSIFPVGLWICEVVRWQGLRLGSLVENFCDMPLWIAFALHLLAFWAGEEMGRLAQKT